MEMLIGGQNQSNPHSNRIQSNNVSVTGEFERGHEYLSWVVNGSSPHFSASAVQRLLLRRQALRIDLPEVEMCPIRTPSRF